MKRKVFAVVTAAVLTAASLLAVTGCNKVLRDIDETKTQLYVGVYNGGLGYSWVDEVAKGFEELYKDYEGEDGKIGIEVVPVAEGDHFLGEEFRSYLANGTYDYVDVFFTVNSPSELIETEYVSNMTELVNRKVYAEDGNFPEEGETATLSLADKMGSLQVSRFTNKEGKVVGIPYNQSVYGFVYDHDLFMENGYYHDMNIWYEGRDGEPNTEDDGWGSDGVEGTYDDGLPATYDDYKALFALMLEDDVTPFTYSGGNAQFYFEGLYSSVRVQVDGKENADLLATYDGYLTSSRDEAVNNANGGQGTLITPENGYLLADTNGAYQAVEFMRFLFEDGHYSEKAAQQGQTNLQAQTEFLNSVAASKDPNTGAQRIAMLMEGDWWETEANLKSNAFQKMVTSFKDESYAYGEREFRFLPLPTFDGQKSEHSVFTNQEDGPIAFINPKTTQRELAEAWMLYSATNDALVIYTQQSGSFRPYSFTMTDEDLEKCTPFTQNLYRIRTENADNVYVAPVLSDYARLATDPVRLDELPAAKTTNQQAFSSPVEAFRGRDYSAASYYQQYLSYYNAQTWKGNYEAFLELYS